MSLFIFQPAEMAYVALPAGPKIAMFVSVQGTVHDSVVRILWAIPK